MARHYCTVDAVSSGPKIQRAQRKRREVALTLSDEARARLEELAEERQESRSAVVEDLILQTGR